MEHLLEKSFTMELAFRFLFPCSTRSLYTTSAPATCSSTSGAVGKGRE